ncbi:MAG: ankyrin repeat domain-containing protein [Lentisphaeria bacterium]|nr:ankyrin repeat domain-containing protein [Lentisphaeria bacterium]
MDKEPEITDEEIILIRPGQRKAAAFPPPVPENPDSGDDFEIRLVTPGRPANPPENTVPAAEDMPELTVRPVLPPSSTAIAPETAGTKTATADDGCEVEIKLKTPAEKPSPVPSPAVLQTGSEQDIPVILPDNRPRKTAEKTARPPQTPHFRKRKHQYRGHKIGCFFLLLAFAGIIYGIIYLYCRYEEPIDRYRRTFEKWMTFRWLKDGGKMSREEINAQDAKGRTEMHFAAKDGDLKTLKKLAEAGGDMKLTDAGKNTILHYAAESGKVEVMKFVLASGDINAANSAGETPLHIAAMHNHRGIVKFLLDREADPRRLTNEKKSAWTLAEDPEIKKLLPRPAVRKRRTPAVPAK